ncbi:hypothetical protein D9981_13385 [Pseudoalteromonas phenolica O-BC30]|nr:hypothetical protein D9981_13385 [Pseudoalteromonas phenolica O-BC30]
MSYAEVRENINSGTIVLGKLELPQYMKVPDSFIPEDQKRKRDEKVKRLQPILKKFRRIHCLSLWQRLYTRGNES